MQMKELTIDPAELRELAPAGFYVAVRIGFAFPMVELNHLPPSWVREYTAGGLMVHDPAMLWAYKNTGAARWSDLVASDAIGVLDLAKDHGLEFGAVVSCTDRNDPSQRSFGLFCRSDREYAPRELLRLTDRVTEYHRLHSRPSNLTSAELETLGTREERASHEGDRLHSECVGKRDQAAAEERKAEATMPRLVPKLRPWQPCSE